MTAPRDADDRHRTAPARRWRRLLPPDGVAAVVLVSGSGLAAARGLAYMPWSISSSPRQLTTVDGWAPLTFWAVLWCVVAVVLLAAAWRPRWSIVGLSALAGLNAAWGISYMWSSLVGGVGRGWVTGAVFLAVAAWATVMPGLLERHGR